MTHNPAKHHRRSIRLKGYDYSQAGMYFITICCKDRICRFGEIIRDNPCSAPKMKLNQYGQIAHDEWAKLSERFPNVKMDVFQIMPNHIHGIIVLNDINGTPAPNNIDIRAAARVAPTVSDIVGAYK